MERQVVLVRWPVRQPSDPVANRLIRLAAVPVAAPSANTSGRPSPTTAQHVWQDMEGKIEMILDGGPVGIGVESTIVDVPGCSDPASSGCYHYGNAAGDRGQGGD